VLQRADIDLQTVEYTHSRPVHSHAAAASTAAPLATTSHADSSAVGGLGFHLLASSADGELELAALLLLACPQQVFSLLPSSLQSRLASLRHFDSLPPALQTEVGNLRAQMGILADFCLCGAAPSVEGNDNPNVDPQDLLVNEERNRRGEHTLAHALAQDQMGAGATNGHADLQHAAVTSAPPAPQPIAAAAAAAPAVARPPPVAHRFVTGTRGKQVAQSQQQH